MIESSSLVGSSQWFLIVGVIFIAKGVISTMAGQALARFGSVVSRDRSPREFWSMILIDYFIGIGLVGFYLYRAT